MEKTQTKYINISEIKELLNSGYTPTEILDIRVVGKYYSPQLLFNIIINNISKRVIC